VRREALAIICAAAMLAGGGPSPADAEEPALGARAVAEAPLPVAATELVFVADPHFGMEGGARTVLSLGRLWFRFEERLPLPTLDEQDPLGKALGVAGRALLLSFVDGPLVQLEYALIHEVFGHGARARDLGEQAVYSFKLPVPYREILDPNDHTTGGASTGITNAPPIAARDRLLLIDGGGLESGYLTARWLNRRLVANNGRLEEDQLLLYAIAKLEYSTSFFASDLAKNGAAGGDDVRQYLTDLQDRFDRWRPADRANLGQRLRNAYLFNLIDPTLVFAGYQTLRRLYFGEWSGELPLWPSFGDLVLYPVPRFELSPFGAEHALDLYAARGGWVGDLYFRIGSSGLASYFGGGLFLRGFEPVEGLELGGELDLWEQPLILLDVANDYDRPSRFGANVGLLASFHLLSGLGLTAKLAAKSAGYLLGQPIDPGVYGYLGLSFRPGL
jgi:hypothetical protein